MTGFEHEQFGLITRGCYASETALADRVAISAESGLRVSRHARPDRYVHRVGRENYCPRNCEAERFSGLDQQSFDWDGSNVAGRHRSNYRNRQSHSRKAHRSHSSTCRDGNRDQASKPCASRNHKARSDIGDGRQRLGSSWHLLMSAESCLAMQTSWPRHLEQMTAKQEWRASHSLQEQSSALLPPLG